MYEGIKDIYTLLDENRLKEALTQLKAMATQTTLWNLPARIDEAQTAYGYMLQYAAQGMDDPTRNEFYRQTRLAAYELTDELDTALSAQKAPGTYYERIRTFALKPARTYNQLQAALEAYTEDIATASLLYADPDRRETETRRMHQAYEAALTELFDSTWATPRWSKTQAHEATALMQAALVPARDLAVLVSAVTLALLRTFDAHKMHFLFDAYAHHDLQVSQRAITGLCLALQKHPRRILMYPEFKARLSLLAEEESFRNNLCTIQMQLLITRETIKIDRKMREEIIPEMIREAKQMKKDRHRFDEAEEPDMQNPEWEEWMDKSGMNEKFKELGEWQMAGADVYMSSFAQLKHYPFFHTMSHWFYPFDNQHPVLAPIRHILEGKGASPLQLIVHSPYFCNSDKYSFALAIISMPPVMKDATMQQMEAQINAQNGSLDTMKELAAQALKAKDTSRQYIQDLYRFFKLWRNHTEEEDIFTWTFDLWNNPLLKDIILQAPTEVKHLADYLLQKDYLKESYDLYDTLRHTEADNAELQQKMGYICQKQGYYDRAIGHYELADLKQPDNLWTIKHLAQAHRQEGRTRHALTYYQKAEAMEPDNLNIAMQIGQSLLSLGQYGEALRYFHKVEYLSKKPDNARRAIAWTSFKDKKFEDALKFYHLLMEQPTATAADYMNVGHVYLAMHDTQQALKYYRKARESENSHSDFIRKFKEDRYDLNELGITDEEMNIVLDLLIE